MRLRMIGVHNAARSQMAEGWARALSVPGVEVDSAGRAATALSPQAVTVMREVGIDLGSHHAKPASGLPRPDAVIDLSGPSTGWLEGEGRMLAWPTDDPEGSSLDTFREVRDAIGSRVAAFLQAEGQRIEFGERVRDQFALAPGITFLNHGSFGAAPRSVLQAQQALRDELEAQPVRFMIDVGPRLRAAAGRLAAFLRADPEGVVFVENATAGVNTVLASFDWSPGDVVVTTSHNYQAVAYSLRYLTDRYGVRICTVEVPFPISGSDDVVQAVRDQWPEGRVRLAVFDHLTSVSGLVWPAEQLVAAAHERGAQVLFDAAHVPGHMPVDLGALNADYWVGNAHKWLFAPKGCAVLVVARAHRDTLHPLVISHGYAQGLTEEFDWVGTRDPTAWLAIDAALDFVQAQGGADRIRAHNVALRARGAQVLEDGLGLARAAPPSMLAALESRALPPRAGADPQALSRRVWEAHGVEAMIAPFGGQLWLRISAQIYNAPGDYRRLADALTASMGA